MKPIINDTTTYIIALALPQADTPSDIFSAADGKGSSSKSINGNHDNDNADTNADAIRGNGDRGADATTNSNTNALNTDDNAINAPTSTQSSHEADDDQLHAGGEVEKKDKKKLLDGDADIILEEDKKKDKGEEDKMGENNASDHEGNDIGRDGGNKGKGKKGKGKNGKGKRGGPLNGNQKLGKGAGKAQGPILVAPVEANNRSNDHANNSGDDDIFGTVDSRASEMEVEVPGDAGVRRTENSKNCHIKEILCIINY
jgi:hypothetical protein